MGFRKTLFKFFYKHCIDTFGEDTGSRIYEAAEHALAEMINEADYKDSKAIEWHMRKNMLPTIAMYAAFRQFEITCESAYDHTAEVLQIACKKVQERNRFIGKMPFGYRLFQLFCRSFFEKQYPREGWDTQWIKYDNEEIHLDITSCIYLETTKKYHCPELCPLFCANDEITLAGYSPNIMFERSGTIGRGQAKCDFHFTNQKYKQRV